MSTQAPYGNIPSLPQLPPSSRLLKALWPRLQIYAVQSPADPLWAPCQAGADGDEVQAKACFRGWDDARIPALHSVVDELRDTAWETFPNKGSDGLAYSGSYWNEAGERAPALSNRTEFARGGSSPPWVDMERGRARITLSPPPPPPL